VEEKAHEVEVVESPVAENNNEPDEELTA